MTTTPPVDCHVVTHVHWDREWYRPFESYRARLVELAARVCAELDDGRMTTFHLDGQTIVLADVQALRPDLADRLAAHARAGRLTLGPWHVLADNQLVSGENLVRNLLTARRWGARVGVLADVGYCPDTFGHPADLPRILNGFGMDTALVWRGAPDGVARFHWRSPDGSQVLAANQGYHAAEVLWAEPDGDSGRAARLKDFLTAERDRLPGGPWLLMNGGDHLAPTDPAGALAATAPAAAEQGAALGESTLAAFFAAAREAAEAGGVPLVEGPLRHRPGRLTFLLPGTFSARTYLKQANAAAQTDLERWAEPLLALHAPGDATLAAELRHAWELLLRNAPHDSICGCSVDEVHRENEVRFERVGQTADHLVLRALGAAGLDTRRYGDPETERAAFAVLNPHPRPHTGPVTVELLTAPGRHPQAVTGPDGAPVPFEAELLGEETAFEADLDLLPDSRPALRHRLHLLAADVPALGHAVHTVLLGDTPRPDAGATVEEGVRALPLADGAALTAGDDAALTLRLADGTELPGLAALRDEGDRGDTYNFDPVAHDAPRVPRLRAARRRTSAVRSVLELDAVIELPTGLTADRAARSADTVEVPLTVTVAHWPGHDGPLRWNLTFDNTADDHRLRAHFPTPAPSARWSADTHYSLLDHPVGPDLGPLPTERAHEAEYGCVPVQSVSAIGDGELRIAVAAAGLPERTGLAAEFSPSGQDEMVVTLLRAVGWLSRFDLNARTTGAGPMMATPEAQCRRRHSYDLALAVGAPVAADADLVALAEAATVPLRAAQLRPGTAPAATGAPGLRVRGARMTALKGAEDGDGLVLRLSNPTGRPAAAEVELPDGWRAAPVRLDESPAGEAYPAGALALELAPYALVSLRLTRP
ncbi:glycosyl hydrolase-related protein [Kitasatospora phosalacinea]|uniref:Glycosyl hydrolase family 38 n=1 Tax=Kitasatospora phosalacinea TaxID=2065 RepID=A0A9W6PMB0_9ACTN|nr:glycosyl hydrolase-related protein [Kitasatospora phosalacinea]GLW57473.1 glycosyl hydrolase family 38 [Kitasatospora phosalacinea]